ncbi:8-amino-7-oxononanoate synthase [Rugosibacter aromaticivorans]|uniref:8-amino-7-oxononanoate synthase n=1 Tax=Rugosibacter aromaticivorans TaxID=1565605 RepID=A0A0C5J9X2_9PROT|nr:8-amino-7-oxononanoate synthase [Rugosibacter aromaticivorans]AJP48494.1 8-amino-7-oxononanoate synthase [Rugosibacter aromaticivorans]
MWLEQALNEALTTLDATQRRRRLRQIAIPGSHLVMADGRQLIDASSNDYLGLSQHPALKSRAIEWVQRFGAGARASRLVTGTLEAMLKLEAQLATFKGTEAALIFNSGFQANATVLPALFKLAGGREALVFTDALNHSSLHAGCRAAWVTQIQFRHNDLSHLDELLTQHAQGRPAFIVTESVFSMDGDRADVAVLGTLAARHGAVLYLDEAHASGVLGPQGRGLGYGLHATNPDAVIMGTLGKAFGVAGAYIAGSQALIDYLVNRCAGIIYSTAPPPAACGAVQAALELIPHLDAERALLAQRSNALRERLAALGIDTLTSTTQIIPAVLGSEAAALTAQKKLEDRGVLAIAIRPPTVPTGSSRLRFALSTALTDVDFEYLLDTLDALKSFA